MKAVLIATDYIKTNSGEYKVLEINTNSRIVADVELLDWAPLTNLIQSNNFTNVHCILPTYDKPFAAKLKDICENQIGGITFQSHETGELSITVPYIEDNESTLILRISYDTTAIIDDEYCRDNFSFLRAIQNEAYKPKTFIPNISDDFADMSEFTYTDNLPNFILKKRYPNYDRKEFPKLYKIQNLTELNTLKGLVDTDTEFLQEFTNSEVLIFKRGIIRSIDLLYGSNLDVLSMGGYKVMHSITENIWVNTFDSNGVLAKKDRPKYITYYLSQTDKGAYIYDLDQEVLMADGTRKIFADLELTDMVKTVDVDSLPLDSDTYILEEWTGSHSNFITNFNVSETAIVVKTSQTVSDLFVRITLDDGTTWDDLPTTSILIKEDDVIKFKRVNDLVVGDVLELFSTETETITNKSVSGLEILFKENEEVGSMDVEPSDLFLPLITNDFALIQHNPCNTSICGPLGYPFCYNYGKCSTCTAAQCGK